MCNDIAALQELAGKAFQSILQVLPTVSGTQREALLDAMRALDDIEAMADLADEEVPDEAEGLRVLAEIAAGHATAAESLGENVEDLALWRSRPVADVPAAATLADGQRGLRLPVGRIRLEAIDSRLPPIRVGA